MKDAKVTKSAKKPVKKTENREARRAVAKPAVNEAAPEAVSNDPEYVQKMLLGDLRDFAFMFDRILYRKALTKVVEHVKATSDRIQFTPAESKQWDKLSAAALAENDPMRLRDHEDGIVAFWSAYYHTVSEERFGGAKKADTTPYKGATTDDYHEALTRVIENVGRSSVHMTPAQIEEWKRLSAEALAESDPLRFRHQQDQIIAFCKAHLQSLFLG
jgi:sulfur relay (sulfurtransferase) DsrC/TusE family protein